MCRRIGIARDAHVAGALPRSPMRMAQRSSQPTHRMQGVWRVAALGGKAGMALQALLLWQVGVLVCAPLSMELEVPDGVVADDAPMRASTGAAQLEPAGRSLGGQLRSMAEDFIPTAIIDQVAQVRKPKDTDGSQTAAPDDGEGCSDQIGKDDVDGMNPLYRCAFDRKKCYEYAPGEVEGEAGRYCEGNVRTHPPSPARPASASRLIATHRCVDGCARSSTGLSSSVLRRRPVSMWIASAETACTPGLAQARNVWMPGTSSPVHTPTTVATRATAVWSRAKTRRPAALAATTWCVGLAHHPRWLPV